MLDVTDSRSAEVSILSTLVSSSRSVSASLTAEWMVAVCI